MGTTIVRTVAKSTSTPARGAPPRAPGRPVVFRRDPAAKSSRERKGRWPGAIGKIRP